MKKFLLSAVLMLSLAAPLSADLKLVQTGTGKGALFSAKMDTTTYIKGTKMRMDTIDGSTIKSIVFDVDGQKIYSFDNKKKEAEVTDMSELREVIAKTVSSEGGSVSVKPNGKTKQILGRNTTGYDIAISLPVTVGGPGGMAMTLNMTGETYVAKGAPGTQDYIAFYKAASEKGFIFGDPKAAKGAPGPSKAMADMFKEFSKMGGVPYESNMQMKGGGEGMASIMAKMFNISSTSLVTASDTASIGDDMFAPPAGYKLKPVSVK